MNRSALRRAVELPAVSIVERLERRTLFSFSPAGGEFRVNTYTFNDQNWPSIALDGDGDFVVAWQSTLQDGGSGLGVGNFGIYGKRFDSSGVAQGGEFRVNTVTTGSQARPAVARDADGDFVVVWQSENQDGDRYGIYGQRYNAAGVAQGGEFRVNTYTTNHQRNPSVAMNSSGDFVVAWQSLVQDGSNHGIYAQRYNAAGAAQGAEFQVQTYAPGPQREPSVAMTSDGDFVVAWESAGPEGAGNLGISAQRYNAVGAAQGSEFLVNTYTTNSQRYPAVAMDSSGAFVVTWYSIGQDDSFGGIYAQRYDAAGAAQGSESKVNTYTTNLQIFPTVAMDATGDFVVAWQSEGQDGDDYGVYAQRYVAGPAEVIAANFIFDTAPQKLKFTFDGDASGGLGIEDILLEKIGGGDVPGLTMLAYGTEGVNVANFTMDTLLVDGNYRATVNGIGGANVLELFILVGDANHDRRVDIYDLRILAANFGGTGTTFGQADFNYDTFVNNADLTILASKWQQTQAEPAPPLAMAVSRAPTRKPVRAISVIE